MSSRTTTPPIRFATLGSTVVAAPTISAPSRAGVRTAPRFLHDAFRPFYLGGSIFAAIAVPLWLGMWYHGFFAPAAIPPLFWHMHEMVFGFGAAIIVGFLFTAARNWTGLPLPAGAPLAILFGLWIVGRVGMLFAYGPVTAVVDSLLLPIVATVLARKFIRARSLCSMPLVGVLAALSSANIVFHASVLGVGGVSVSPVTAVELGLMLVVLIELIVGGRVVPAFTASGIPSVRQRRSAQLHRASFAITAAAFAADGFDAPSALSAILMFAAAAAIAVQAAGWNPLAARRKAMLWVLHLSYWWIPVGLVLLGMSALGVVPRSAGIHALAAGSMGGLMIGMITRTALGHSGRPVRAGRAEVTMYVLVLAAALFRVVGALVPAVYLIGMSAAGVAWTVAFATYAIAYGPLLLHRPPPRDECAHAGPGPMGCRCPTM